MKEIKTRIYAPMPFADFLGFVFLFLVADIYMIVANAIDPKQPVLTFTLMVVLATIECIVLLYLLYFTVQLLNPARCVYSQKGVTKVGLKKTIFNLAWDDIEAVYCMRFMIFPFFLLFVDKKKKAPVFVYDLKKRRKKVENGGLVVSLAFMRQLIEIQKLCPINIQMSKKVEKSITEKLKKQNVKSETFFPQPRNEIFVEFGKKVSQQQIHTFEKEICDRVVCLPLYEKLCEEAESQGYYCKAEGFDGNLKNKEYRSYLVVKIIDKNGDLVHENGFETGVFMLYKTLCYSTLFHRIVGIKLHEDENFIKELTDFSEKLKNQVCKTGE